MFETEQNISPLIDSMLPALYREGGEDFVTFIRAYYEWLETNHQLLELSDTTNFNIGDIVTQDTVTGTIIAYLGTNILVHVDGIETFRCYNVCNVLIPIVSSSGGEAYITKGGTTKRLGSIFLARNLPKIRDIDKTIDLFIVKFKEKYLKNIEFDISTNKQLLIKNSLDLYRSKGSERSIDLFFRLVYGAGASVYYPGDDLFKLSAGKWIKPQYLEIYTPNISRTIDLVGKQITGATSGATAFVDKYIKRKVNNSIIHVIYLSSIAGEFIHDELIYSDIVHVDSPKILGSVKYAEIISGGSLFEVGDIISVIGGNGAQCKARVTEVVNETGIVAFTLIDGGYGYTNWANSSNANNATQTIVSEKVLTLSNVQVTNCVSTLSISSGGSGYSNSDLIKVSSLFSNANGSLITNSTGGIITVLLNHPGGGFYVNNPTVAITNSSGGTSTGTSASILATTKIQPSLFKLEEPLVQNRATFVYDTAANNQLLLAGQQIRIGNSSVNNAFGIIISNANGTLANANGTLQIGFNNAASFGTGNTLYLISNASITANIVSITNTTATSVTMKTPTTANLNLTSVSDSLSVGDEVYQTISGSEIGNAYVSSTTITLGSGVVSANNIKGVLTPSQPLLVRNKATTANLVSLDVDMGVYNVSNNFTDASAFVYTSDYGTTANCIGVSLGSGADFEVGGISETETILFNTDLLGSNNYPTIGSNQTFMSLSLNASKYGFAKNPTGNSSSIILSCLNYDPLTIGVITSLTNINPGENYNISPKTLVKQPFVSSYNKRDYVFNITDASGPFTTGEKILQSNTTVTKYDLVVSSTTGYQLGEAVYQGTHPSETAVGYVDAITVASNTIKVRDVTGTFTTSIPLKSYISTGLNANTVSVTLNSEVSTAKTILKSSNTSVLFGKRIQFNDLFTVGSTIKGVTSGATATIASIIPDANSIAIGLNAIVSANATTANNSVSKVQITDSGLGYSDGDILLFQNADGTKTGELKLILDGTGIGQGFYKTYKGVLSSTSKLHDGEYYQEYSYDVMSKIPLNKYAEMFKKVMHVAGTKFFGSVMSESSANIDVIIETSINESLQETAQFNANSDVSSGIIHFNNAYANTSLKFNTGQKVTYYTNAGNTALISLGNNTISYIANANSSSVALITNPRRLSQSFNANTKVNSNFITLTRHRFVNSDVVMYYTNTGNTALTGLSNSSNYYVVSANSAGIKLSATRGGSAISITPSSISESGHNIIINNINIIANNTSSGANTSGHFITHLVEA
jgi:hypothetical protein